jgi:hypothetical protein
MATACPQWDQKPTWVSRSSQCLCQEPCAAREKPGTCGARNHTPSGNDLLGQYQNRDRGDHNTFITPPTKSNAISAQQQPMQ